MKQCDRSIGGLLLYLEPVVLDDGIPSAAGNRIPLCSCSINGCGVMAVITSERSVAMTAIFPWQTLSQVN